MADYSPQLGKVPAGIDLTHGIIQATYKGRPNTTGAAIARRLALHGSTAPSAYDDELLIPPSAPDLLRNLAALVALYEAQLIPNQLDLLGITTLRFPHDLACHRQWELARGFAKAALVDSRGLAVELVHHLPGLAGRKHKPHIHLMWPARRLNGSTWGAFSDLVKPGATTVLAAEWAAWLTQEQ